MRKRSWDEGEFGGVGEQARPQCAGPILDLVRHLVHVAPADWVCVQPGSWDWLSCSQLSSSASQLGHCMGPAPGVS